MTGMGGRGNSVSVFSASTEIVGLFVAFSLGVSACFDVQWLKMNSVSIIIAAIGSLNFIICCIFVCFSVICRTNIQNKVLDLL